MRLVHEEKEELKNILEEVKDEAAAVPPPMPDEQQDVIPPSEEDAAKVTPPQSVLLAVTASGQPSVDELMAQIRDRDAKLVELSNLQAQVEDLTKKNAELEQKLMDSVKDKETIAQLTEKIRTLEEENNRLIQQVQNNPSGTETPKDEQISALTAENARLQKEIEDVKGKASETESLRSQLTTLQAEHEALKAKPPEATAAATPEQTAQIETLTKENAELKAKVESLSAELRTATETKVAEGGADVSNGQTCTAEVTKAQKVAAEEKQVEMATLAKENMTLKQKLAQFMGGGKAKAPAETAADITAQAPIEAKEVAAPVTPEEISNIVAADYPPPAKEQGQTEAQRQEAEMMNSMGQRTPASTPELKKAEDITWNCWAKEMPRASKRQ